MSFFEQKKKDDEDLNKKKKTSEFRYALQEFMNDNGEIFSGLSEILSAPEKLIDKNNNLSQKTEALRNMVEKSKELSIKVASTVFDKPESEVNKFDVKAFRRSSANCVTQFWKSGQDLDIDELASLVSSAAAHTDPMLDINMYKYLDISSETTLIMTAANVNLRIAQPVMVYDFRTENKSELVNTLSSKVLDTANECVKQMIGENGGVDDKTSLLQTLSNNLAEIMASCYKKKTFYVLRQLNGKSQEQIDEFYNNNDPVKDILDDFNRWSIMFASSAFAFARGLQESRDKSRNPDEGYNR